MSLVACGLSHHNSAVDLRERLAFTEERLPEALALFQERVGGAGVTILSTCNRMEVYAHQSGRPADELIAEIRNFLADYHGVSEARDTDLLYDLDGADAAGHLFRVTCSLDSLVVGEGQILGQVHDAYLVSHAAHRTDKVINALFQRAFALAKKVRTETGLGAGKVSVSSVAIDLAESIFAKMDGKTALIIGTGKMSELTLRSLMSKGVTSLIIMNRSLDKAQATAAQYGGEAVALADVDKHLHRADIILSSTAAKEPILNAQHFTRALKKRDQDPMFVIDIALPRDIDPEVNNVDNVYLYNIDDLSEVANRNMEARREEMDKCLDLVEQAVARFDSWLQSLAAEPTIVSMTKTFNDIRERELEKTLAALPDLTDKQREEVEYLSKRIINNILQRPMSQLKHEVVQEDPSLVLHLVKRLFGIKEST